MGGIVLMNNNNLHMISEYKDDSLLLEYYTENIYKSLSNLNEDYSSFEKWYFEKVIPGIKKGDREIIITTNDKFITGVSILKNTIDEKKICTLRVNQQFRKNGVGKVLFEKSLETLNCDSPVITVSQERVSQFSSLLNYFGFELSQVISGYYKQTSDEYVYNGVLSETQPKLSVNPQYVLATT